MKTLQLLDEPTIEVHHGQQVADPRHGLALFGPSDASEPSHPAGVIWGAVGTPRGVELFQRFARALSEPTAFTAIRKQRKDGSPGVALPKPFLWPAFPGFEAAFHSRWPTDPGWSREVDASKLHHAARHGDGHRRAFEVVGMYREALNAAAKRDDKPGVVVCIVPDEVFENCRPESKVVDRISEPLSSQELRRRRGGQQQLFQDWNPEQYVMSPDFRRQLKARAMEMSLPIQIIRESTLEDSALSRRSLTPLSDRKWNLSTALYYKAGGRPWRLASAREGVCYIGMAFRRTDEVDGEENTAACAAQMFLDSGDGIMFLGQFGPWYSPKRRQCHLTPTAAQSLLSGVLETYAELDGRSLKEIFLHSRSGIDEDEFAGYSVACPPGVKLVGVRVRTDNDGVRLFRPGGYPVIRGTLLVRNARSAYLWASGFKPSLWTYDGSEVPVPLKIDIQHGDADIVEVAKDILGLTKLNYNSCRLGDAQPVTVGFSDAVGEILVANKIKTARDPRFRYYI